MPKLTDEELVAAIESEEALALDKANGELAGLRATALARYKGDPLGNEVEGRSQVVDKSVADTIEWIMPSLVRIYLGGDDIGQFEAIGPEDEAAAKAETEVCNWYLQAKNDYFSQINATLRDALLLKNGYMVAYWNKRYDTMTETYLGQSDEEAAMLMQDPEVTVVEHSEYPDPNAPVMPVMGAQVMPGMPGQPPTAGMPPEPPPPPMLHDIKVELKKCEEYVSVESVPPDEMLVSRRHRWTSLLDADFVQWRRRASIGQLRAEGFDIPDDTPGDLEDSDLSQESTIRQRFSVEQDDSDDTPDPSRRIVTMRDTYMRIDLRNENTPQLWRVAIVGKKVILREEADIVPFAAFSPIIYAHSHIGTSIFDLISDIADVKTAVQRQYLDGLYLQTSGRTAVDVNRVNLDDLLVSRPGGIVRVDGDPNAAMFPLVSSDLGQSALSGLEYLSSVNEQRTGVTRYSAGLDANTLNKTATGVQAIQSAANQRIELIARTLAGGFRDLFLVVHALALKHSTKPLQIKLSGSWTQINPREWKRRTDFTINVGLGTGTPESQLAKLQMLAPFQGQAAAQGLAGPMEMYNFSAEIFKAAGYRNPQKFIHEPQRDPQTGQPMSPPQHPPYQVQVAQMKAQSDQQAAQLKAQSDQQIAQVKAQADASVQQARMQADMMVQQHKVQTDAQLQIAETKMQMQLEAFKHNMAQQAQIEIAKIKAAAQVQAADITATKQAAASGYAQEMSQ